MATSTLIQSLKSLGFGDVLSPRIAEHFKNDETKLTTALKEDPYVLMDIEGIGFIKADNVARAVFRLTEEDPRRQRALILKTLDDNKNFGHVFLPITILEKELKKNNVVKHANALEELQKADRIVVSGNKVFHKRLYDAEVQTAFYLKERKDYDAYAQHTPLGEFDKFPGLQPDDDQIEAIRHFKAQNMMVMTGGPGTGKTQTIKTICALAEQMHMDVALCAPTGKAAKRMKDLTGRNAMTIHRLLKAGWGWWKHNRGNQLTGKNLLIVDECSMLDVELAFHLLDAIPTNTKIIFVGDVDQLPPVGPGSFFRDLIKSGYAKVVRLKTNHRQGLGSGIADVAMKVNKGDMKFASQTNDIGFIDCLSPIDIRSNITKQLDILKSEGYDLVRDVQILTPQHKTNVGTIALNELLRFYINKKASPRDKFSVGDKVMQNMNDYTLGIFNGYIGAIRDMDRDNYIIEFFDDDRPLMKYPKESADGLMQAWACTIHKYQGSEAKAGIPIICSSHIYQLSRNLLYTAITRFKEKCIIMGDSIALRKSIVDTKEQERYSDLPNLLDKFK